MPDPSLNCPQMWVGCGFCVVFWFGVGLCFFGIGQLESPWKWKQVALFLIHKIVPAQGLSEM